MSTILHSALVGGRWHCLSILASPGVCITAHCNNRDVTVYYDTYPDGENLISFSRSRRPYRLEVTDGGLPDRCAVAIIYYDKNGTETRRRNFEYFATE